MTLDEYFATGPDHERPIFEAVRAALAGIGPMQIEPVSVGIFLKNGRSFAQLRPRDKWVNLLFGLEHQVDGDRIRSCRRTGNRFHHVVRLFGADDVDDEIRDWLAEAHGLTGSGT